MDLSRLRLDVIPEFPQKPLRGNDNAAEKAEKGGESFADTLKSFLKDVNQLQSEAADHVEALVAGETVDIHDVMIAIEKASVSFEMVMEIRNKILEAYQELLRTQV